MLKTFVKLKGGRKDIGSVALATQASSVLVIESHIYISNIHSLLIRETARF